MTERVFEIRVIPLRGDYKVIAVSGELSKEATVGLPTNLQDNIKALQNALTRAQTRNFSTPATSLPLPLTVGTDEKILSEIGEKLYSFLFADEISGLYHGILDSLQAPTTQLRVKLRLDDAPELARIPWEAVYDKSRRSFIAAEVKTSITRGVTEDNETAVSPPGPLTILGMVSGARSFRGQQLVYPDVANEQLKINTATEELQKEGRATLSWTLSGSYRDFRRGLRIKAQDGQGLAVFHYIGHGDVDELGGYLIFQEQDGPTGEDRRSDTLAPLLTQIGGPKLVILNSCYGARPNNGDIFSSLAASLCLSGVSAVIAMQFVITESSAVAFSSYFYRYLSDGYSVSQALGHTRIDLRGQHVSEWVTPVLYLRGGDREVVIQHF